MPSALERALARFRPQADGGGSDTRARISAAEFRAATEQRLRSSRVCTEQKLNVEL